MEKGSARDFRTIETPFIIIIIIVVVMALVSRLTYLVFDGSLIELNEENFLSS